MEIYSEKLSKYFINGAIVKAGSILPIWEAAVDSGSEQAFWDTVLTLGGENRTQALAIAIGKGFIYKETEISFQDVIEMTRRVRQA